MWSKPTALIMMLGLTIGGCTVGKDGHTYVDGNCVTCLNNPLTGEALNYAKTSEDYVAAKDYAAEQRRIRMSQTGTRAANIPEEEGIITFSVGTPIDIAYLRVKKEFGFYTLEERAKITPALNAEAKKWLAWNKGFQYDALPGVRYHLREYIDHSHNGVQSKFIDAILENNGAGTDITFSYWVPLPTVELTAFGDSLKQRALKALR